MRPPSRRRSPQGEADQRADHALPRLGDVRRDRADHHLLPGAVLLDDRLQPATHGGHLRPVRRTRPPSLQNYSDVFDPVNNFTRALFNSIIVAGVTTTVLVLIIGIFSAYALARLDFRGKNLALSLIIATSMFPGIALVVPLLKIFTDIGWINTYQALILPSMSFALPLSVWNLTAFFRQMPQELEQAAMVDGCTQWQAFRKIIIPLAAPGVFTTAIIAFVAAWNEFIIALTMTNKSDFFTAVVAVSQFTGTTGRDTPFGTQMAAGVILTIPLVIMVLAFQRRIVSGLTAGGVK